MQKLKGRIEQIQAKIDALEEKDGSTLANQNEIDRLKRLKKNLQSDLKNNKKEFAALQKMQQQKDKEQKNVDKLKTSLSAKVKERNDMEAGLNRTKPPGELKEEKKTLERQNEEDKRVIEDANTSPSEREAAEARVAEREEELARLQPQIQEREEALPLRERARNIFKKYGWTLRAVVPAAGIAKGAASLYIVNALKAGTKAVGNGLKTVGKQLGFLLIGLSGSIVSFIFKAAGQVISFLGEHPWLLILAVVTFLFERLLKKRRS